MSPPKNWAFSGSKKGTKHLAKVASMPRPGSRLGGCTAGDWAIGAPSSSSGVTKTVRHRRTPIARRRAIRTVRTNGGPSDLSITYEGGDYDVASCVYKVQISTDFTPKTPSPLKKKLPGSKLRILGVSEKPTTTNTVAQGVEEGTLVGDRRKGFEITPHSWYDLPLFNDLQILGECYFPGDYILVNNPSTSHSSMISTSEDLKRFWVAEIIDIRAESTESVYLRINWMYWPEDLPIGRQTYHGAQELIWSNHMDVIDAHTVAGLAGVTPWNEDDDKSDNIDLGELYWRQSYDPQTKHITSPRRHCACKGYHNPDTILVRCEACDSWLHEGCLADSIKKDVLVTAGIITGKGKKGENSKMQQLVNVEWDDDISRMFVAFDGDEWYEKAKCLCCYCYVS